jgi:hypothetical protein
MALNDWLSQLNVPIEERGVLSDAERQRMFNLARRQSAGAMGAGMETLKEQLGGRGFRVGESGAADTAMGKYILGSQEALSQQGTEIATDEAKRRAELAGLNIQRLTGAGGLQVQQNAVEAQKAAAGAQARLGQSQLEWEKNKFSQTFPWEKEQAQMGWLQNLLGMMGQSQQDVYAPYWNAIGQY